MGEAATSGTLDDDAIFGDGGADKYAGGRIVAVGGRRTGVGDKTRGARGIDGIEVVGKVGGGRGARRDRLSGGLPMSTIISTTGPN
jgi:hypothetical protein